MHKLEIKTAFATDDSGEITGIAWPFDGTPDRSGDLIERNAFVAIAPMPMLWQHDPADVVGVWTDISETPRGLQVKGHLLVNDVAKAREVHALVKAKAVTGLSIGYQTKEATGRKGGGRLIKRLEVVEISLVSVPMHPNSRISSAKSATEILAIAEAINRAAMAFKGN